MIGRKRSALVAGFVAALATACGGGGGSGEDNSLTEELARSFEGIYELNAWTDNPDDCGGLGDDQRDVDTDSHFVAATFDIFGQTTLGLTSCVDVEDCRSVAEDIAGGGGFGGQWGGMLTSRIDDDSLGGFTASTGFQRDGVCTVREYEDHVLAREAEALTFTTEVKLLSDQPAEDGFCTVSGKQAMAEAADTPCASLRTIRGTLVEPT